MRMKTTTLSLMLLVSTASIIGCNQDPGEAEVSPQYRSNDPNSPEDPTSGERGNMMITEIGWAGSVDNDGNWDPDDVFIEIQNRNPRPINMTNWRLIVEGDYVKTHRIPQLDEPLPTNGFLVIAAKKDGAFGEVADVIIEDLKLGKNYVHVELRDMDRRLNESAGSDSERVFTGGYDTYSTRSMERVQIIFGNRGSDSRNWHAYSEHAPVAGTVAQGWEQRTFASPGVANSQDYSGSSSAGGFE